MKIKYYIIILIIIAGCEVNNNAKTVEDHLKVGTQLSTTEISSIIKSYKENPQIRDEEKHLFYLESKIPGFSGIQKTKDKTIIFIKDLSKKNRNQLISNVRNQISSQVAPNLLFEERQFTISELAAFRDLVSTFVLGNSEFKDIEFVDLNENKGLIIIALQNNVKPSEVEKLTEFLIHGLEIPNEAFEIEKVEPLLSLDNSLSQNTLSGSINSHNRPLVGGLGIQRVNHEGMCTMGFIASLNGEDVFITNSHCTDQIFNTDLNTTFFQGLITSSDIIGSEYSDPNTWSCGQVWPPFHNCRRSDAAAIKIAPGVTFERGKIVRTEFRGDGVDGSTNIINTPDPTWSIAKIDENPSTGAFIQKIGRTTGWTSGNIINTCVDVQKSGGWWQMNCQTRTNYRATGGDSGSPVFRFIYDENGWEHLSLLGIHWGSSSSYSYYSPISGIMHDLGTFYADDPNSTYVAPSNPPGGGVIIDPCIENPLTCHEQ
ncbi:MAG: hypothetical protein JJ966_09710 [Balneolaceae bacterium]|nr:hypothetical protein [Balneolaceae bacterium]